VVGEVVEKAQEFLRQRRLAYLRTLDVKKPDAQMVLEDLAKFCRAHESTFHADPRMHAVLEGRREVWLRIQQHLELSDETLWKLYGAKR
jgi:hypothetical protein